MHKGRVTTRSMHAAQQQQQQAQAPPAITLADVRRTVCDAVAGSLAVNTGFRIEKYFGDISADAEEWIDNYEDTTTLKGWDDAQRFKNFNQFLERDAKNWYKLYVKKAANPPADWAALRQAFIDYHVPPDREKELRDKMVNKKQGTDDVVKYITEKRLLCLDLNPAMGFDEMKKHIIDGMHPEIKVTITHKVNNNMANLLENAKNIEKGLKASDKWNSINQPINQNDALIAKTLSTVSSALEKLLITQEETKEKLQDIERQNRRENRERPRERHVEFDRHGRRVIDRSRDNYVNNSRNSSYDSYRGYSTDRGHSPYRQNDNYRRFDKSERYPERDRSQTPEHTNRTPELKHKPILKKPHFENARRFNDNKGFNGENKCFNCGKYGHIANQCPLKYRQQSPRNHRSNALHSEEYDESEEVGDLIFQTIEINGHKYSALIDSGSTVSLISEMIVRKLKLNIRQYRGKNIKNVDGLPIAIVGEVDITVKVNFEGGFKETDILAAVIRNFQFDVLLGNDYNQKAGVMIDCRRKCLIWPKLNGEHSLSLQSTKSENYVHLLRDVTLQPLVQVEVKVTPKDRVNRRSASVVIKTDSHLFNKNKILINDTPIEFIGGKASIRVINCSNKEVTLKSGTIVGVFVEEEKNDSEVIDDECELYCHEVCISESSDDETVDGFDENEHRKKERKWMEYVNVTLPPINAYSGRLIFERQKNNLIRRGCNLATCDWYEGMCKKCNWFLCRPNECQLGKFPFYSRKWRQTCDRNFKDFESYKDNFMKLLKKDSSHRVNMTRVSSDKRQTKKTMEIKNDSVEITGGHISVNPKLSYDQKRRLQCLLEEYNDIFAFTDDKLGHCKGSQFRIQLIDEKQTPLQIKPYKKSFSERDMINTHINHLLNLGVIEPSRSNWSFSVLLVPKKSTNEYGDRETRMCVDYRPLNKITQQEIFPMPDIQTILSSQAGKSIFSLVDDNQGYHQYEVAEEDRPKTAFCTEDGLYQYKRIPFGLMNAPAFYQREQSMIFQDMINNSMIVYFDDKFISSKDFEEHMQHLNEVFKRLRDSGLTLKAKKCKFGEFAITFLGYVISKDGIEADPEKVRAIVEFPTPTNLKAVRGFVGLAGFYRRKVKDFAKIAEPLTRLTRKVADAPDLEYIPRGMKKGDIGRVFIWDKEQQNAFDRLKYAISSAPILVHFDNNLPIEVHTDGSLTGIGGVLYHIIDGELRPFYFLSYLLHGAEVNYSAPEIECLAIVKITAKCSQYLIGKPFEIVTDCLALKWMKEKKSLNNRILRWSMHMQNYIYTVRHRSGKSNVVADALSRYPHTKGYAHKDNIEKHCLLTSESMAKHNFKFYEHQITDPHFGEIYRKLLKEDCDNKVTDEYVIHDKTLLKKVTIDGEKRLVVCVPLDMVFDILFTYHDDMLCGGHFGRNKTTDKIKSRYFWPNMRSDIEQYVSSCKSCQYKNMSHLPKAGLMIPIKTQAPFEMIGIDFLGRFPKSIKNNQWILVATDYFTKWAIVEALPFATKELTADFIIERIVCQFGAPNVILSDRGTQFRSELCQQIFEKLSIQHVMTTSYHPQTNGLTERYNGTLGNKIAKYVNTPQNNWDFGIKWITFTYNTTVHATTGFTPFKLLYGREAVNPADRVTNVPNFGSTSELEYLKSLDKSLKHMHTIVRENIEKAGERNKAYYDKNRREVFFNVGDKVLVYYPTRIKGKSEKLLSPFHGPFTITKCSSNGLNYDIEGTKDGKRYIIDNVHISRIKPFKDREELIEEIENRAEVLTPKEELISESETELYDDNESDSDTEIYEWEENYENENMTERVQTPIPSPRRSTRSTRGRPPKKLTYLTIALLSLLLVSTPSTASLQKLNPIVWRKSDKPVISGVNRILIIAGYQSPCDIFLDKSFIPFNNEQLKEFCDKRFNEDYIHPLKKFCKTPDLMSQTNKALIQRKKRLAIVAIGIIAFIIITVVAVIGVTAKAIADSHSNTQEIDSLKAKQIEAFERTKTLEENQIKIKEIITLLQDQVDGLGNKIQALTQSIQIFKDVVPHFVVYVAHIASKLSIAKEKLIESDRSWKDGKVNPKLLELFNITLPCWPECDLKFAEPRECLHNEEKRTIQLMFDIKSNKRNVSILTADPFTLYSIENKTYLCQIKYTGPSSVVYNEKNDCIIPLPTAPYTLNNLVVMPKTDKCQNNLPHNFTHKYWKFERCEQRHFISPDEVVQIKAVGDNNHIFCNGFKINLYNRTIDCPDFVFALPITTSFSIGSLNYETNDITIHTDLSFAPDLSQRVNFQLMPDLHNLEFKDLSKKVRSEINGLIIPEHYDNWEFASNKYGYGDVLLIILLVGITLFMAYLLYKKKLSNRLYRIDPERDIEIVELNPKQEVGPSAPEEIPSPKPRVRRNSLSNKYLFFSSLIFVVLMPGQSLPIDEYLTVNIYYDNLCKDLWNKEFSNEARRWCNENFQEAFIDPLRKFCKDSSSHKTIDRFIFGKMKLEAKPSVEPSATNFPFSTDTDSVANRLGMAKLAAKFLFIKNSLNKMGLKWLRGEIDEQFMTSEYLQIKIDDPNHLNDLEPHSCLYDLNCKYLRLEFRHKKTLHPVALITGWKNAEEVLTISLSVSVLICLIFLWRLKKVTREREFAYRFAFAGRPQNRDNHEIHIPPPYPEP